MADEQDKKIKEIEASLARELDQQVNLSTPADSRLDGAVDLNPALNLTPKTDVKFDMPLSSAGAGGGSGDLNMQESSPSEPELSLDDLDSLLKKEAPDLEAELNILREAGKSIVVKDLNLAEFDLDSTVEETPSVEEPPPGLNWKQRLAYKAKAKIKSAYSFFTQLPIRFFRYVVKFVKEDIKKILVTIVTGVFASIKLWASSIARMNRVQKLYLLGLFCILGAMSYLLKTHFSLSAYVPEPYLESFTTYSEPIKYSEKPFVSLSEEGSYEEFVVLLDKVVVNIKPSESSSRNPMVAVRLYFEVSTQEAAIELKDREKEMRDLAQRVLETFTYDQIISAGGKKSFKESLRKEMSSIMNNGMVKNVFIDDILLKP